MVIEADRYSLRPPHEDDVETLAPGCADPRARPFPPDTPSPCTRADLLDWVRLTPVVWERGGVRLVVADSTTGEVVGAVALGPPDDARNAEISLWITPSARGRGAGTAAVRALTSWAFGNDALPVRVERIELMATPSDAASQKIAYAAGYRRESLRRRAARHPDGSRTDLVAFARLADDPESPVPPFLPPFPGGALSDGVIRLVPLTPADADDYHAMMCLPDVMRYRVPATPVEHADSLARCVSAASHWISGERAEIAIRDGADDSFAGHIQLMNIIPILGEAMIGYSLAAGTRGRGTVTRAVNLLVDWTFAHTTIQRITAGTDPDNVRSQRVLERAGFTREGVLRHHLPRADGTRADNVLWARIRTAP
ncbi:GNAT family N-acetyltransferase [Rhizohabitans arisaemae]|uniref:GNAT family N-acetyltransferase n=1 Tax=Rhizohabitans arisaemae TaxID=2720610 RepID=UPI0024B1794D|nr:GNAT family protein [Rhizohabitans arisaemae]